MCGPEWCAHSDSDTSSEWSAGAGVPWGAGTLGSTWGHMPHTALHSQPSLYDPMSQSLGRAHPRLQELAEDQLYISARSQSPESGRWFNVPFDDTAQPTQPAAAGSSSGVQYRHRRASAEQAVQPQVAVRDSNVDFDMDTGFSDDDDAPPPLPAEPPPGPVSTLAPHTLRCAVLCCAVLDSIILCCTVLDCLVEHTWLHVCSACGSWAEMYLSHLLLVS